ncbi:monocarboxylate transporter, putative, partial [Ixodes scapularis]
RALACGISFAGLTVSGLVFPPLLQFLLENYGPKGMFLVTGALMLNATGGALLQRIPPETPCKSASGVSHPLNVTQALSSESKTTTDLGYGKQNESQEKECVNPHHAHGDVDGVNDETTTYCMESFSNQNKVSSPSYLRRPKFYIIAFASSVIVFNMSTYSTVTVDFATDRNVSEWNAVLLLMMYAIADLVSRLGSGWFTDKGFLAKSSMMTANLFLWALSLCVMPFCYSFYLHAIQAVVVGWCNGATLILVPVLLMELVNTDKFSECFGVALLISGIPLLLRPTRINLLINSQAYTLVSNETNKGRQQSVASIVPSAEVNRNMRQYITCFCLYISVFSQNSFVPLIPTALGAGLLARRVAIWKLTLSGCLLSSLSVSVCFFANGIPYLTFFLGATHGCGIACLTLCNTVISQHFCRYRTVASGISNAGFTLGSFLYPPLLQFFLDEYGTKASLLLCGSVMLNATAGALLHRLPCSAPRKPIASFDIAETRLNCPRNDNTRRDTGQQEKSENKHQHFHPHDLASKQKAEATNLEPTKGQCSSGSVLSFFTFPSFYLIAASQVLVFFIMGTYTTIIVDFSVDNGISRWYAISLVSLYNATDMIARFGSGLITDRGFLNKNTMMALHFALWSVSLVVTPFCTAYYCQVVLALVGGWCNGCTMILIVVFFVELVGIDNLGVTFGVGIFFSGACGFLRPSLIGERSVTL